MGYGVSLVGVDRAGGVITGPGISSWTLNGSRISLLGDSVTPHAPPDTPHSGSPVMVQGSSWFTFNGIPVVRQGNLASCGHGATGQDWFTLPE